VKVLSGENELSLLAKFYQTLERTVLDEPTNDLDIETLDPLGTPDMPSARRSPCHDRAFINNADQHAGASHGSVNEYAGGCDDWLRQSQRKMRIAVPRLKKSSVRSSRETQVTFKEHKELETLSALNISKQQQQIIAVMADPTFYRESGKKVTETKARLEAVEKELVESYARWESLAALQV
jgi:ATP-binding cassette subfamily F protein uup